MAKQSERHAPPARAAVFHPEFRQDLRYWVEIDRKTAMRAFDLIEAILRDPLTGIGKPEPLKYLAAGAWSRRLTQEHRIVYLVAANRIALPPGEIPLLTVLAASLHPASAAISPNRSRKSP